MARMAVQRLVEESIKTGKENEEIAKAIEEFEDVLATIMKAIKEE